MPRRAVAVIGTGTIGRSWIRVFTRGGYPTRTWDPDPEQQERAWTWLKADLKTTRKRQGLRKAVARSQRELVTRCATLEEALDGVAYVQESAPEDLALKQRLFQDLDARSDPGTILATSSSSFGLDQLAGGLGGRHRCIVAHPLNDPHTLPPVEVHWDEHTNPAVVRRTTRFLLQVGQQPLPVRKHRPGLVMERLEAAVIREAIYLLQEEVADVETVEAALHLGLGLNWATQGPLRALALKADGGLHEHLTRYAAVYQRIWSDLGTDVQLTPDLIDRLARQVGPSQAGVEPQEYRAWRDDLVERIQRTKTTHQLGAEDGAG